MLRADRVRRREERLHFVGERARHADFRLHSSENNSISETVGVPTVSLYAHCTSDTFQENRHGKQFDTFFVPLSNCLP